MCVSCIHHSLNFFPDYVCGIVLIAMNKSSAVPSICLHIFPTVINLAYQLITFQSFFLCHLQMLLLSFCRCSSIDSELEWITQDCMLIAGMLCGRGEGVLFEWRLCMTFTRVPSSAYKGDELLCSALSSRERDCFLWKWTCKKTFDTGAFYTRLVKS